MEQAAQTPQSIRVLVIDDDPELCETLELGLSAAGLAVSTASSVPSGIAAVGEGHVDLVLLDLELSGDDGMDILRYLQRQERPIPVIIMTGSRVATEDTVEGLKGGADDYVRKPFAMQELMARINAVYRRHATMEDVACTAGDLTIDRLRRTAECHGQPLILTPRELELLALFARNAGKEITRSVICDTVWSDTPLSTTLDNTLDVHVSRLRKKLDECTSRCSIATVWGKGFRLDADAS